MIFHFILTLDNIIMPYQLEIVYRKELEDHSGYCSDPGTITKKVVDNYIEQRPLNMSVEEVKENFDEYGNFIGYISDFNYTKGCQIGSGYCGLETKYIAISAKIVKTGGMMSDLLSELESEGK